MAHLQTHDLDGADHGNVVIVDLADGQVLAWNDDDGVWENVEMTGGPGGGDLSVAEDGVEKTAAATQLNFTHGIDVSNASDVETIAVDESELSHASLADLTSGDPHTQYALESGTVMDGDAAGGDLSGTYPSPSVVDDSHSHTSATVSSAGGAPPTGSAGGDLSGTYPNPSVTDDSHAHTGTTIDESSLVVGGDLTGSVANAQVTDDSHNHTGSTLGSGVNYASIAKLLVEP